MSTTKKPEEKIADVMQIFSRIVGVDEIPDALVQQVSYRIGTRLNNTHEKELRSALNGINIAPKSKYSYQNFMDTIIEFNVDEVGTGGGFEGANVKVDPSFDFNGNKITISQVNRDLFTVVEKVVLVVLGKTSCLDITSPLGFQFMHDMVKEFLGCYKIGTPFKFSDRDKNENYFKRICAEAQNKILGDGPTVNAANVNKYLKYLKKENALAPFKSLESVSADTRILFEIPFLADKAIEMIIRGGFTYEESVTIYNARFGSKYEPYTGTIVICSACYKTNNFFAPLKFTEKCFCGKPLFRKCGKDVCGAAIPNFVDTCPQCGHSERDAKHYDNLIKTAKSFADKGLVALAEEYLIAAQAVVPHRKAELDSIKNEINEKKLIYQRIVDEIETLINNKTFYSAGRKLAAAKKNIPYEILKDQESRITTAINNAEKLFATVGESAQKLNRVLAICADHAEALKYRDKVPPKAPSYLSSPFVNINEHIQVSWNQSQDIDVMYHLIRKKGNKPTSISDGELICKTKDIEAIDRSPIPGLIYYAVFTKRGNRYSIDCAENFIKHLPPVPVFNMRMLRDKRIEFSYSLPTGASGVKIMRSTSSGKAEILYEGSQKIAFDSSPPRKCTYTIRAVYDDCMESIMEKKLPFDVDAIPKEIKPQISTDDNRIHMSWSIDQTGYMIKIIDVEGRDVTLDEGDFCPASNLGAKTKEIASARCEELFTDFSLQNNRQYNLAVLIGNQNGYLCCLKYPFYVGIFPKLIRKCSDVDVDGTHYFSFDDSLPDDNIIYAISKQNKIPDSHDFRGIKIDSTDFENRPVLKIRNYKYSYVGQYYIFCSFRLKDGSMSVPISSKVHFRQEIRIGVKLSQNGKMLSANLNINLINYDYEGFPELPPLILKVDGSDYPLRKINVSSNNRTFKTIEIINLLTPANNLPNIKLVPADPTFLSDYRIVY